MLSVPTSCVAGTYRSLDRSELVQAVVPVMWEHLWADGVLRKGLDTQRILDVRVRLEALQATITALDDEARQLRTRSEAVTARARATADKDSRSDLLLEAIQASHASNANYAELARLERAVVVAQKELENATSAVVALPEELDDDGYERLLAEAIGGSSGGYTDQPGLPLSSELTVDDVAELLGVPPQTINRWYREGAPRGRVLPWANGEAWIEYSKKNKRLQVDRMRQDRLTEAQKRAVRRLRQRRAQLDSEV